MKLIKLTNENYIICNNDIIKEGDYYVHNQKPNGLRILNTFPLPMDAKKVTHSTQPNKGMENVTFISLREIEELLGEIDVEQKAEDSYYTRHQTYNSEYILAYKEGYNQALEDNKEKNYTEEDVRVAIRLATTSKYDHRLEFYSEQDILQFLQLPTSWEVEFIDGKLKLKN